MKTNFGTLNRSSVVSMEMHDLRIKSCLLSIKFLFPKLIYFFPQVDVEEVQFWISRSEAKIQDRTLDPHYLKTNLNEIQSEITGISEQLDNLLANGKVISEKTECSQEKELVLSTTTNLTEQLGQLKQLIQDKKNAANDDQDGVPLH